MDYIPVRDASVHSYLQYVHTEGVSETQRVHISPLTAASDF